MRIERLFFVIGILLMGIGAMIQASLGTIEAKQYLDEARRAPNPTVMRLDLEAYKLGLLHANAESWHLARADKVIDSCTAAEKVSQSDTSAYTAAYAGVLTEARGLSGPTAFFWNSMPNTWVWGCIHFLSFYIGGFIAAVSLIAMTIFWIWTPPASTTSSAEHETADSSEVHGESDLVAT